MVGLLATHTAASLGRQIAQDVPNKLKNLEEGHDRDANPEAQLATNVRYQANSLVVRGLRRFNDVAVGDVHVKARDVTRQRGLVILSMLTQQDILLVRWELFEELVYH